MKRVISALFGILAIVVLTGCAGNLTSKTYNYSAAQRAMTVEEGVVDGFRTVRIEGRTSPSGSVGTVAGAALGAIAGASNGGGLGRVAVGVVGSLIGGLIGNAVEQKISESDGIELTIRLNSGALIAVTQAVDETESFRTGDRVRILTSPNGISRVIRI